MGESENYLIFGTYCSLRLLKSIQLNELMKLSEYQRSRSFFVLGQRSLRFQIKCLTFGLFTQVSDSGPHGLLV